MWRYEDGGPRRQQTVAGSLGLAAGEELTVTTRTAPAITMAVGNASGDLYLLRHTGGEGAISFVEQIDPLTLEPLGQSPELAGGPTWPGGVGIRDDGSLDVVFGNHAHHLSADLRVLASCELPRHRPYNSFVALPDGTLITKDFGGSLPGAPLTADERQPCELIALSPDLAIVARVELGEASIARLSADGNDVYVVGDTHLIRVHWDGKALVVDDQFNARYRTIEGQTYGWDCVIAAGAAWFLDDGDGSEGYTGTLRGHGLSTAPLHLVKVDLATGDVTMAEVSGSPGLIANPPAVDEKRGIVVGYDSGNGVVAAFATDTLEQRWRRDQDHGSHLILYEESGELVTGDNADVVVLDIETGAELARADTGSGIQSVLFPCPGTAHDFYVCTFLTITRLSL
jgi:hypothetical protein